MIQSGMNMKTVWWVLGLLACLALIFLRLPPEVGPAMPAAGAGNPIPARDSPGSGFDASPRPPTNPKQSGDRLHALLDRLFSAEGIKQAVTVVQIRAFLERNRGRADAYLAAFHADGETNWLVQAAQRHPDDPQVQFAMIAGRVDPEHQREWIERLKQSDPDNPMASYFSASDYFQAGNPEAALRDLAEAVGKHDFRDYVSETIQSAEGLYLESGYSPVEAKILAGLNLQLPHVTTVRNLGRDLNRLRQGYLDAGDTGTATAVSEVTWQLGRQFSGEAGGRYLLNELVGLALEGSALKGLPGDFAADYLPGTVAEIQAGQQARKAAVQEANKVLTPDLMLSLSEQEWMSFFDRRNLQGERAALQWIRTRRDGQ